jgi:two-component system, chemotaxis family, chemotaxis protein CheY
MTWYKEQQVLQKQYASVNILIVDDIAQMRETVRSMLRAYGYSSLFLADSGNQALGVIGSKSIDMVITDWSMPNMPGIELVKKLKNDPKLFTIPMLMISDERTMDKVLYAIEEGVDSFLVKPFSEQELIKHVKLLFRKINNVDEIEEQVFEMRRLKLSSQYREALELGYKILNTRNHPRVVLMLCECLYHVKEYDKAMNMIMDSEEESRNSEHTNLLGKIYMKLGKHDQGILYLEQSVNKNGLNQDRKIDLARAYVSVGRINEAEGVISAIINAKPTDLNLVDIAQLYLDMGEVDKAGLYLNQTVDPIPETVSVFNNYAIALRKSDRYEESATIYKRCLQITPGSEVLHYNLGFLLTRLGRLTEAKAVLQKALKLNPDDLHAKSLLQKIDEQLH